jgi:hypothetical protein
MSQDWPAPRAFQRHAAVTRVEKSYNSFNDYSFKVFIHCILAHIPSREPQLASECLREDVSQLIRVDFHSVSGNDVCRIVAQSPPRATVGT